jgi:hypothetical protein
MAEQPSTSTGSTDTKASDPGARGSERPVVIFLHIGKTAGTTMRHILRRQFPSTEILLIQNRILRTLPGDRGRPSRELSIEYFANLPEEERARARLIIAHTVFGLHRFVPHPATYLTLLRDPVALTISQYSYVARNPRHPLHTELVERHPTLEHYVRSGVAIETDNSQTRAISGDIGTPFGGCTEKMLETAKRNIEQHFSLVGLTERFDESLLLMRRTFGWSHLYYVRANVTPQSRKEGVSPATQRMIEEQNRLDAELYAWAAARFRASIESDPTFERDLRRFRRRNALYRPVGMITSSLPRRLVRSWRR